MKENVFKDFKIQRYQLHLMKSLTGKTFRKKTCPFLLCWVSANGQDTGLHGSWFWCVTAIVKLALAFSSHSTIWDLASDMEQLLNLSGSLKPFWNIITCTTSLIHHFFHNLCQYSVCHYMMLFDVTWIIQLQVHL